MSNTGFTIGYNCILRDQSLSLATKGLYLVVSSYIGMPEWKLTKNTLNKICGTAYAAVSYTHLAKCCLIMANTLLGCAGHITKFTLRRSRTR